jgi:6-phosphogluconolactonase
MKLIKHDQNRSAVQVTIFYIPYIGFNIYIIYMTKLLFAMRTGIFSIILILFTYLIGHSSDREIYQNSKGKSECYIYVSVNKEKKIIIYKLDPVHGELVQIGIRKLSGEPGTLCSDPSCEKIYAGLRDLKSVASLSVDKKSGRTTLLKETPVVDNPVYISTDPSGKYLFLASYSGNKTAVYPIEKSGVSVNAVQVMDARVNPHMIKTDPSGKYVFVPNLGGDVIQQFILQKNGMLKPLNPDVINVMKGSGPRHFTFHPSKDIMYVVNELSCTIMAFHFNSDDGTLNGPFQEIRTLPADYKSINTCADIHITPDGKFLFASNRGHDSLAGYSVNDKTGELKNIGYYPTEKEPREFAIDPSGKFIISAGESSGKIALYRIKLDGSLVILKTYETGEWPVWVLALEF